MANEQPTLDQRVLALEIKVEELERLVANHQTSLEEIVKLLQPQKYRPDGIKET